MQISLIAAVTVDGFIGRSQNDRSFTWTSGADKLFYLKQIKAVDTIVIGRRTFETFSRYPKGSDWVIYTTRPQEFKNPRPEVIEAEATDLSPDKLLAKLKAAGKEKIMICGGSSIYTLFMRLGVVDKLYLTVEPTLFGKGIKLFNDDLGKVDLKLIKTHQLSSQVIVLEYEVKK